MERVPIALIGCGGMGRRHLTGLAALARSDFNNVRLVAVCDLNPRNAEDLAEEAAALLGERPRVFTDLETMVRVVDGLAGASVTTDTGSHHRVAAACLEAGLHTMVEKPLAITIRGCDLVLRAARQSGRILSVAENYRRDPINRLARALLVDGAIGQPQLIIETSIGGGNTLFITPWRHNKYTGALTLDAGVHHADLLMYYLGPVREVYGEARLYERYRYKRDTGGPGGFYAKWADQVPAVVEATGEDALFAYLRYENGVIGQWVFHHAGHGRPLHQRLIYGSQGCLELPGDRNGRPIVLYRADGSRIADERILDYAPSYRLNPLAAQLFGGERVWTYTFPFPETDAKILALEYHEFGECLRTGQPPEVTGEVGKRAVALVYAAFESGLAGRAVTLAEVESGALDLYQRAIDAHHGLVAV